MILCSPRVPQAELDELVAAVGPVVLVNRSVAGVPAVRADYRAALADELAHLYGLGHRRIVYLAGAPGSVANASRLEAIAEFRSSHSDVDVAEIPCGVEVDSGEAAADTVLASGATAALAFNDLVALGLLGAVTAAGRRVPRDLSIVGFDDIPFARYATPSLTTAAVPAAELGAHAWTRMRGLLDGGAATPPLWLRPRLIVRGSTAAPSPAV